LVLKIKTVYSFIAKSKDSEILIISHLRVIPRKEALPPPPPQRGGGGFINETGRSPRHIQKGHCDIS